MEKMDDRVPATAGMKWQQRYTADGEKVVKIGPVQEVVASCGNKAARGCWVCLDHHMAFTTEWEKSVHFDKPRKKPCHLAWFCAEHGVPEVP